MRASIIVALLACANVAFAESEEKIHLDADAGYNRVLTNGGSNGFGLNVYGGYDLGVKVIPELQVGLAYHSSSAGQGDFALTTTTLTIPIMAGIRYRLKLEGPITPFAAAHLGLALLSETNEVLGLSATEKAQAKFGFNAGVGANYAVAEKIGIGIVVYWWMLLNGDSKADVDNTMMLTAGLNFSMAF